MSHISFRLCVYFDVGYHIRDSVFKCRCDGSHTCILMFKPSLVPRLSHHCLRRGTGPPVTQTFPTGQSQRIILVDKLKQENSWASLYFTTHRQIHLWNTSLCIQHPELSLWFQFQPVELLRSKNVSVFHVAWINCMAHWSLYKTIFIYHFEKYNSWLCQGTVFKHLPKSGAYYPLAH